TADSGSGGSQGDYHLIVNRGAVVHPILTGITAGVDSGTASRMDIAAANPEQTITLTGTGFVAGMTAVFTTLNSNGDFGTHNVTVTSVYDDGTSADVIVPDDAVTGTVRLQDAVFGQFLQIVPVVLNADLTNVQGDGTVAGLNLIGFGFVESGSTYTIGSSTQIDVSRYG